MSPLQCLYYAGTALHALTITCLHNKVAVVSDTCLLGCTISTA